MWKLVLTLAAALHAPAAWAIEGGGPDDRVRCREPENASSFDACILETAHEWNVSLAGGTSHAIHGSAGDTEILNLSGRWGTVFSRKHGIWQFGVEVHPVFLVLQGETVYGAGVTPAVRRFFRPLGRVVPSFMVGLGVLATTSPIPRGEASLNFTPKAGLGIHYFVRPRRAVVVEYRFHHISNAGQTAGNPGINSSVLVVGYSVFR